MAHVDASGSLWKPLGNVASRRQGFSSIIQLRKLVRNMHRLSKCLSPRVIMKSCRLLPRNRKFLKTRVPLQTRPKRYRNSPNLRKALNMHTWERWPGAGVQQMNRLHNFSKPTLGVSGGLSQLGLLDGLSGFLTWLTKSSEPQVKTRRKTEGWQPLP